LSEFMLEVYPTYTSVYMTMPLADSGINDQLVKLHHSLIRCVLSLLMSDILER